MKNFIQEGNTVEVTLIKDAAAGDVVVVGGVIGIAVINGVIGDTININRKGVYLMPVASVLVIAVGDKAYVTDAGEITNVATDNTEIGVFLSASADGDVSVELMLG